MAFHNISIKKKNINFKFKINNFSLLTIPFAILLLLMVILPFFFIIFYSLTDFGENSIMFTIDNFVKFLVDNNFWAKLGLSIYFAAISTLLCLVISYPIAYFMARTRSEIRTLMLILITLPMWVNTLLRGIALKSVFELITGWFRNMGFSDFRIIGTDFAVIFGETMLSLPFMIIPIYTQLLKLDPTLIEASKDLGSNSMKTFMKVTLPISMPGVISGVIMVFLPAATSIVIPKYMGGGIPRYALIGNLIENYFVKQHNFNEGCAMSIIMCVIILLITFIVKAFDRSEVVEKKKNSFYHRRNNKLNNKEGVNR